MCSAPARVEGDRAGRSVEIAAMFERGDHGVAGIGEFQDVFDASRLQEQRMVVAANAPLRDIYLGDMGAVDVQGSAGVQWRAQDFRDDQPVLSAEPTRTASDALHAEAAVEARWYTPWSLFSTWRVEGYRASFEQENQQDASAISATRRQVGLAAFIEKLLWRERVSVDGALRFDAVGDEGRSWRMPTGALGASWRMTPWWQWRTNLARTWRAPDFDELYLDTSFVRGDPDLRAERSWQADAGAVLGDAQSVVGGSVVGFGSVTEDRITFVPTSAYQYQAQNLSDVRARGVEATAQLRPLAHWTTEAAYTLTDAYRPVEGGSFPLPNQPLHRLFATSRLDIAPWLPREVTSLFSSATIEGSAQWRSAITLDPLAGLEPNPSWWRLDAAIDLRIVEDAWGVRLDASNLLDVRRAVDGLQRPLPGRALYLSVSANLDTID